MRLVPLLIAALAGASAAAAQPAEDRYGPARAQPLRMASNSASGAYQGKMLSWSSRAFTPQIPEQATPVAAPRTIAPQLPASAAPAPPRIPPPRISPPRISPPRVAAAPAPALPDSLYSPPPAAAPVRMAQAQIPAPATPGAGSHVRLYSVHRQYGMAPDAIPAPPASGSNYVLIGADPERDPERDGDKPADAQDRPF